MKNLKNTQQRLKLCFRKIEKLTSAIHRVTGKRKDMDRSLIFGFNEGIDKYYFYSFQESFDNSFIFFV